MTRPKADLTHDLEVLVLFKKILIANRGEIALRIIRACKEMGLETVAVYSEADRDSMHVERADEAVCIGPSAAKKSYLNISNIISAAEVTGADAVHPGYGFLAENDQFAEVCESSGFVFIGPSPEVIREMGHKAAAKKMMAESGIPVIPGTHSLETEKEALTFAQSTSFPLVVKATAGGGGRGMRVVEDEKKLLSSLKTASSEAKAAFGNGEVYLEKYIKEPRHIEFQILADCFGNVVHLGERDCSIQRRHQKLVEEAPSPALTGEIREKIGKTAVKAAKAIKYSNAGTIEFLVDGESNFYFMEMNTRIQVEHPVTEMVTGIDLVKEQIKIAAKERLDVSQGEVKLEGHAIEFRINAEDPERDFLPSSGRINFYSPPGGPGVRLDSHLYSGFLVSPFYDSMLAKLIVWGRDRNEALARAKRALQEFIIEGVQTTIPFHLKVLEDDRFKKGVFSTHFAERILEKAVK